MRRGVKDPSRPTLSSGTSSRSWTAPISIGVSPALNRASTGSGSCWRRCCGHWRPRSSVRPASGDPHWPALSSSRRRSLQRRLLRGRLLRLVTRRLGSDGHAVLEERRIFIGIEGGSIHGIAGPLHPLPALFLGLFLLLLGDSFPFGIGLGAHLLESLAGRLGGDRKRHASAARRCDAPTCLREVVVGDGDLRFLPASGGVGGLRRSGKLVGGRLDRYAGRSRRRGSGPSERGLR